MANPRRRLLARAAAGGVVIIGSLTLAEHVFDLDLGIDQRLVRVARGTAGLRLGRMSMLAAADFLLLGAALLLISVPSRAARSWIAQACVLLAAFGAFIAVTGYLYGRETLGLMSVFTSTAPHTAVALLALSVGVACARPADGVMALFNSVGAGGALLRRLLLPVTMLPVAINWIELESERRGVVPAGFGWMFDSALTVLLVGLAVWTVAHLADQKDVERRAAEDELHRSEERYRQLIDMSPMAILVKDARRIEFANPAALELVVAGHADDMLGKSPFAFVHPDSRATFEKALCRVLGDGTPLLHLEQRVVRLDGREIDVELSATPVDYHGR